MDIARTSDVQIDTNSIQIHIHSHVLSLKARTNLMHLRDMRFEIALHSESASSLLTPLFRRTLEYGTHFLGNDSFHTATEGVWQFESCVAFKTSIIGRGLMLR